MSRARTEAAAFLAALRFLTRLPLPAPAAGETAAGMAAALRWLPAAGAVVGAIGAAVLLAAATVLPPVPAVLLAAAATALVTGALHEDGLADTFDGLAAATPERALAIMRDSRIGAHGALALGLFVALKVAALAALPAGTAAVALVAGQTASRFSVLVLLASSRYLRPEGTAGFAAAGLGAAGLGLGAAVAVAALAGLGAVAGAGRQVARAVAEALGCLGPDVTEQRQRHAATPR